MDFEIAVVGVGLARQQALELALRGLVAQLFETASASATIAWSPSASPSSISSSASSTSRSMRAIAARSARSSRVRSRISVCAASGSSQSFGSSALAFSSSRRRVAASQSKMPPQQRERLLDVVGDRLCLGAHAAPQVRRTSVPLGSGPLPGDRAYADWVAGTNAGVSGRPSTARRCRWPGPGAAAGRRPARHLVARQRAQAELAVLAGLGAGLVGLPDAGSPDAGGQPGRRD